MFGFIKKLFGFGECKTDGSCCDAAQAPYKIEAAVQAVKTAADVNSDGKVNLDDAKAVVNKAATQVAKGARQVAKKTAPKKPQQGKKPQGQKPAGAKPAGNKPRGRKPKAKPATPQQ